MITVPAWMNQQLRPAGRFGVNQFGRLVGVNGTTVMAWRDGRAIPEHFRSERLSEVTGEPLEIVRQMLHAAHERRSAERGRANGTLPSSVPPIRKGLAAAGLLDKPSRLVRSARPALAHA